MPARVEELSAEGMADGSVESGNSTDSVVDEANGASPVPQVSASAGVEPVLESADPNMGDAAIESKEDVQQTPADVTNEPAR